MQELLLQRYLILWMVLLGGLPGCFLDTPKYLLSSSKFHHILSGDIEVRYKVPANAPALQVQLVELYQDRTEPLAKMDIPRNTTSGIVIFPCGLLVQAEESAFKLITVDEGNVLAETKSINVRWPSVSVHVPLLVETYSSDVIVRLHIGTAKCKLRKEKDYSTYVDLVYYGPALASSGVAKSIWQEPAIILSKELDDWLLDDSYDVTLSCEYFDRAGYYKVRIRTTTNSTPVVAESETIHVIWSHRYSVSVTKNAVEPCDDSVKIIYHYPRCASDRDRLRVYGKMWRGITKPLKYIFESRVQNGRHFTKLSCDLFGEDLEEFCFSFVSTAKNGAVFELDTQCIPRFPPTEGFLPSWQNWEMWSECSSTCGPGVHSRYRLCSSPNTDIACEGKSVQTEICNNEDCPESNSTPSEAFEVLPEDCLCGCQFNFTSPILIKIDSKDCPMPIHWIFQSWPSSQVSISVSNLAFVSLDTLLIVREGGSSLGRVLGISGQSNGSEVLYLSSAIVRLEIYSPNVSIVETASMKVQLIPLEISRASMAIVQTNTQVTTYHLSTVHITMILLTVIVCTVAVFLVAILYIRNVKQLKSSARSSFCSLSHPDNSPNGKLLVASTSTSELSDSSLLYSRSPKRELSDPSKSPEDYLHNSFLFRSFNSICDTSPSAANTPTPRKMHFNTKPEALQSPTISESKPSDETITSDFDATKKPLKSAMKKTHITSKQNLDSINTPSPVRRRGKVLGRTNRQIQRDSTTPLTASVSELSMTGSEDGFEYDYYDYGCHDEPGSFFCPDPILVGWPPFIPHPPEGIDDLCDFPLQHFTPSPTQQETDADVHSTKSTNS